jgi:purine-binding chemotaxis protein CheW
MPESAGPGKGKDAFNAKNLLRSMQEEYWKELEEAPLQEPSDLLTLLSFRIGRERFAVAVTAVREVTLVPALLSRIPRSPEVLLGVMNLRGQIVPILDFHPLLGLAAPARGKAARVVILRGAEGDLGILAEEVFGLDAVSASTLQTPLKVETALPPTLVKAQARVREQATVVLDAQALMSLEILGPLHS